MPNYDEFDLDIQIEKTEGPSNTADVTYGPVCVAAPRFCMNILVQGNRSTGKS